jgi:uncharacterized membrane protein YfcA
MGWGFYLSFLIFEAKAPMPIDPLLIALGLATLFAGGFMQGLSGFGFALIGVPVLSLFLSPKVAAPIIVSCVLVSNLLVLYNARRDVQLRRIWPLCLAGVLGVPFGAWLLHGLSVDGLRLLMGSVVTAAAALMALGVRVGIKRERLAFLPVGFSSGMLSGSIGVGGPPVILFFTNQQLPKSVFRANIVAYFTVLNLSTNTVFITSGVITSEVLRYTALFLPGLFAGVFVGARFTNRLPDALFRRIAFALVIGTGLVSVLKGLGVL